MPFDLPTFFETERFYSVGEVDDKFAALPADSSAALPVTTPEKFDAVGDGVTLDDDAMRQFWGEVYSGNHQGEFTSGRTYRISAPIVVTRSSVQQCNIDGNGARILQAANNVPIVLLTGDDHSRGVVRNLVLDYVTKQDRSVPATAGAQAAWQWDTTNPRLFGWYNNTFDNIQFGGNCYRGFQTTLAAGHKNPVWGTTFRQITGSWGMTGTLIYLDSQGPGCPNNTLEHIYQHREFCSQPTIKLVNHHGVRISDLEVNQSELGGTVIDIGYSVSVVLQNIRTEVGIVKAGEAPFVFTSVPALSIDGWEVNEMTYPIAPNKCSLFRIRGGTAISLGPGSVNRYDVPDAGSNVTILDGDAASRCTRFEGVHRPNMVKDFSTGFGITKTPSPLVSAFGGYHTVATY